MMIVTGYASKKELKEAVGQPLKYRETSIFGDEYKSNGSFAVAHRPSLPYAMPGVGGREFFATVTMENDLIKKVE